MDEGDFDETEGALYRSRLEQLVRIYAARVIATTLLTHLVTYEHWGSMREYRKILNAFDFRWDALRPALTNPNVQLSDYQERETWALVEKIERIVNLMQREANGGRVTQAEIDRLFDNRDNVFR